MNDVTTGAGCTCRECREYRLWRIERTDEWQPTPGAWERAAGISVARREDSPSVTTESLPTEPTHSRRA